jgi:hypothetical protein
MYSCNFKVNSEIPDKASTWAIIKAASNPKSILEISAECGISLTAYRRVYDLCDCKLLEV